MQSIVRVILCLSVFLLGSLHAPQMAQANTSKDAMTCYLPTAGYDTEGKKIIGQSLTQATTNQLLDAGKMIGAIVNKINTLMGSGWKNSFNAVVTNPDFRGAVAGVMVLYLTIFGVMIVFNLVQVTWYEVFVRLFKMAVVVFLISNADTFASFFEDFFIGGMNELIGLYGYATAPGGSVSGQLTSAPLMLLVEPLELVFNMRYLGIIAALPLAGVAGFGLFALLVYGTFHFLLSVMAALATYIKAVVGLAVLFGIAPIFIACLLFEQTRRLFDGWLTMVLSFALQPVFSFAFLGFFMVMILGVLQPLLSQAVCHGVIYEIASIIDIWWFFPIPKGKHISVNYAQDTQDLWAAAGMHVHVVDALMFAMLSSLSWRYSSYVEQIARELAGGQVSIGTTGGQLMEQLRNNGLDPASLAKQGFSTVKDTGSAVRNYFTNSDARNEVSENFKNLTGRRE